MNVPRLDSLELEQELELLKRSQVQLGLELRRKLLEISPKDTIQNEDKLESLRRFQVQQRIELERNLMKGNPSIIPIQELEEGAWQTNRPDLIPNGVQNPIQGFEMEAWQRKGQENNPDQSPHMGVGIPIEGFEMRAWQPNGQGTAHEQSAPVQMPPPEVQNTIQDYEEAWHINRNCCKQMGVQNGQENAHDQSPVQMPPQKVQNPIRNYEMGAWHIQGQENVHEQSPVPMAQNPIQEYEDFQNQGFQMGAWQTNSQENAHEQSTPVQIPQMGIQNPIQDEMGAWQENAHGHSLPVQIPPMGVRQTVPILELLSQLQSWKHHNPPPPFFDPNTQAWIVAVPIPVSLDGPLQTESDEGSAEVPQTGPNVPQIGPAVPQMVLPTVPQPQISPNSGLSLTSGFVSDSYPSTNSSSRPSPGSTPSPNPGSSPGPNLGLTPGSNPESSKEGEAQTTWVLNPKANEFIPGGNQPSEMVPKQELKELSWYGTKNKTNPPEKSQNYVEIGMAMRRGDMEIPPKTRFEAEV